MQKEQLFTGSNDKKDVFKVSLNSESTNLLKSMEESCESILCSN